MSKELVKIILVDAVIVAGAALLVVAPNLVAGVVLWALLLGFLAAILFATLGIPDSRKGIARSFLIGEGITILRRINRGERIL